MSSVSPSGRGNLSLAAAALALVAGVVFLVALAQHESGRYFSKTVSLEKSLANSKSEGEFGYRVPLPKGYRENQRVVEQALVLEDGKPLPLRIEKIKHVCDKGRGRYRLTRRGVYLSTPDNLDPRSNGRRYELRVPLEVRPLALWLPLGLLAGAMFCLLRSGLPVLPRLSLRPWVEPALVFAVSFATMLWSLGHFSDYSDGWLVVKGAPFSDGIAWVELSKSLSEGRGFSGPFEAHRGGYPLLLGGFFSLAGGSSVMLAKIFNALMLAVGSTAIYLFTRSAFGRIIGAVTLAGLLMGTRFEVAVEMTLTEPTAFALAAVGLHQLYRACLQPAVWRFLIVGIFFGLSNLVRPFTLLALPIFGALILFLAWRGRWGWRRFGLVGAAYVGGAMLIFGPWVLRQKLAWGVATLDLNSAVMLYGAAEIPEGEQRRSLSSRHYIEADAAGFSRGEHGSRYRYYMERYQEVVAEDPAEYLGFVAGQFVEFFNLPGFADGHVREKLGVIYFLALLRLAWRRRFPPLILLAGLWPMIAPLLGGLPALLIVAAGALLGIAFHRGPPRLAVILLVVTLFAAGVLNALVGNFGLNRGTVFIEWIVFLVVASGIIGLARFAAGRAGKCSARADANHRISDAYPLVVLAVFAAGFVLVVAKSAFGSTPDLASWKIPDDVAARACAEVEERAPTVRPEEMYVRRVKLGDYRWFIRAGEDVGHWARPFEVRDSDRTMAMPLAGYEEKSLTCKLITINLPGDQRELDGERDFLLVGVNNIDDEAALGQGNIVVETLALIPYQPAERDLDLSGGIYFPLPPDFP